MPNLLSDSIGEILRGVPVQGQPQPDQQVSRDLEGNLLPNDSASSVLVAGALEQLTELRARIIAIEAHLGL